MAFLVKLIAIVIDVKNDISYRRYITRSDKERISLKERPKGTFQSFRNNNDTVVRMK